MVVGAQYITNLHQVIAASMILLMQIRTLFHTVQLITPLLYLTSLEEEL